MVYFISIKLTWELRIILKPTSCVLRYFLSTIPSDRIKRMMQLQFLLVQLRPLQNWPIYMRNATEVEFSRNTVWFGKQMYSLNSKWLDRFLKVVLADFQSNIIILKINNSRKKYDCTRTRQYTIQNFMVQLQAFTTNDYLLKNNCFDNKWLQNRKKN